MKDQDTLSKDFYVYLYDPWGEQNKSFAIPILELSRGLVIYLCSL